MAGLKSRNNMTGELKDKQGKVATTDEEAAEIHAEYAESVFKPLQEEEFDQKNVKDRRKICRNDGNHRKFGQSTAIGAPN